MDIWRIIIAGIISGIAFIMTVVLFNVLVEEKKASVVDVRMENVKFCEQLSATATNQNWSYKNCVDNLNGKENEVLKI